jgi:hypothetical protein
VLQKIKKLLIALQVYFYNSPSIQEINKRVKERCRDKNLPPDAADPIELSDCSFAVMHVFIGRSLYI